MKAMITVMMKELKDLFRDRRTGMIGLLMGPLLLPVLMLGMFSVMQKKVTSQSEKMLELPVIGAEHAPNLVAWLNGQNVTTQDAPEDPTAAIRNQDEEVILRISPEFGDKWRGSEPALVEILYDASQQDSEIPVRRIEGLLNAYSSQVGALRLLSRGISPSLVQSLAVSRKDIATPESLIGRSLVFLPYLLILSAFIGGAHLVIDVTAGERERQSLEPLLATPASRGGVMSGKIAAACAFGFLSLLLTLIAFKIGFQIAPGMKGQVDVSVLSIARILLVLTPMLLIGTTLLTLISASVKSVKEAQSYMSLLIMLPMIPTIFLMVSPVKNALWQFTVPFLSQNQMIMNILRGEAGDITEWLVYLGAGFGLGAILWIIAARLYHRESLAISA